MSALFTEIEKTGEKKVLGGKPRVQFEIYVQYRDIKQTIGYVILEFRVKIPPEIHI